MIRDWLIGDWLIGEREGIEDGGQRTEGGRRRTGVRGRRTEDREGRMNG